MKWSTSLEAFREIGSTSRIGASSNESKWAIAAISSLSLGQLHQARGSWGRPDDVRTGTLTLVANLSRRKRAARSKNQIVEVEILAKDRVARRNC